MKQESRLKYSVRINPSSGRRLLLSDDSDVSFLPMELIGEYGSIDLSQVKKYEDVKTGYTYFEEEDVVFAKITPCFENGKGTIGENLVNKVGYGTTELHVLRPIQNISNKRFIYYLTMSHHFRKNGESEMYGAGGQKRVPSSYVENYKLYLPSIETQKQIADFLDKETARIDTLISKKQKQIELLQEKRQAIITQAVTKGLNPGVKMKDSGVEWIGEIPGHWEVRRLRHVISLKSGSGITSDEIKVEDDYPVYGGNGLRGYYSRYTHAGNYVLIGRQGALCRNINYASGRFWASEHAVVATPLINLKITWLGEILRMMNLNQYSISAAQPGLAVDRIKDLQLPVPPIDDQIAIENQLKVYFQRQDELSTKIRKSINLLKEYRSSLITHAVSGQIDIGTYEVSK